MNPRVIAGVPRSRDRFPRLPSSGGDNQALVASARRARCGERASPLRSPSTSSVTAVCGQQVNEAERREVPVRLMQPCVVFSGACTRWSRRKSGVRSGVSGSLRPAPRFCCEAELPEIEPAAHHAPKSRRNANRHKGVACRCSASGQSRMNGGTEVRFSHAIGRRGPPLRRGHGVKTR